MPAREILVLAVTRMLAGVCTAGVVAEPRRHRTLLTDAGSGWGVRWVRPVKTHDTLLLGDLTDAEGRPVQPWDVVDLPWQQPQPQPPHVEDWQVDWVQRRPRILRLLEGERRARFLARYLDPSPADVLGPEPRRSLCLVRPTDVWCLFRRQAGTDRFQARLGFLLEEGGHPQAGAPTGVPVTDLRWRALGRACLGPRADELSLRRDDLLARLGAREIYLCLGLGRLYRGQYPLLVIGVHVVPDYAVTVDYAHL